MNRVLKFIKDCQPVIIGLLILWVFLQWNSHSTFIEDRDREFKHFQDSVTVVNNNLYEQIATKQLRIDSLGVVNAGIDNQLTSLDNNMTVIKEVYHDKINSIDYISNDSNIILLTKFLSEDSGD